MSARVLQFSSGHICPGCDEAEIRTLDALCPRCLYLFRREQQTELPVLVRGRAAAQDADDSASARMLGWVSIFAVIVVLVAMGVCL